MECSSTIIRGELDETETRLRGSAGGVRRFVYEYDFGDSWTHEVVIEDFAFVSHTLKFGCASMPGRAAEDVEHRGYEHSSRRWPIHCTKSTTTCWSGWASGSIPPCSACFANVALQRVR